MLLCCSLSPRWQSVLVTLCGPQAEQWTLRRCCAIDLDVIACAFGEDMLPSLLPILKSCFQTAGDTDDAWHARECGILALGVIAEGAGEFMFEYFGMIAPFLVSELRDPRVHCSHRPVC